MSSVLFVRDIEVSKKFYTEVLNQEIIMDFGRNVSFESGFAIWEIWDEHIIPRTLKEKVNSGGNSFELYFETPDIVETERILVESNVSFIHNIIEEPWGQNTLRFFDPDGHIIEIGETLESFVKRFHDSGMDPGEIFKRTSIPVDDVKRILGLK